MSFYNSYKYEEYKTSFDVPDGDWPVVICKVEEKQTKNGKGMLEVSFRVADILSPYYVERYVEGEYFNKSMSRFFDAFKLQPGNFTFSTWIGKRATAHFEHVQETYTAQDGTQRASNRAKLKYLVVPEKEQFPEDIPYSTPSTQQHALQPMQQPAPVQMSAQDMRGAAAAFNGTMPRPQQPAPAAYQQPSARPNMQAGVQPLPVSDNNGYIF